MKANIMLTKVDRVGRRLGPLNALVEGLVERIVPHETAKACHADGFFCTDECINDSGCAQGTRYVVHFAPPGSHLWNCIGTPYNCSQCNCYA